MNLKVYRKTRYQNIYQHIKNKNYVVQISKPVKTTISSVDDNKIWKLEDALKIRDNPKLKLQKGAEIKYKDNFDDLWDKYIYWCENVDKQAYNTISNKNKIYNKHIKEKFSKTITKITKNDVVSLINNSDTTDKQKNHILKQLSVFFNWCIQEDILIVNPTNKIRKFKTEKVEMKYWLPNEVKTFFQFINEEIENENNIKIKETAYRTKIMVLIGFVLGDRIGETRALTWNSINKEQLTLLINHSINYDTKSNNFTKTTKTYNSTRKIDITQKLIDELDNYRYFLENELIYNIKDTDLIFFNYTNNRPYSDVTLRKGFYKYSELANVSKIRMYDLRHTYVAMMMSEEKELYLISERLGHTSFSTTVNKYGHLSNQIRKEVAETTDKYI